MAVTESGHLASREVDDLYRRHGGEIYRYAFAVLGNHADAEDVTQTTFLNAYRSLAQGVRPRKPANWLLAIASNAIKQRFRQEQARPRQVELDERTAHAGAEEEYEGPTVGELLAALSKIPPQQRQAIVLREFEGRSYAEIAEILGVTTTALETLLFRARRSLAEELEHQLTCTEAQQAISRAVDDRLGRKERRRLRDHLAECPDCSRFASVQQRHRRALKGLMLVPIPLSLSLAKGFEGTATAAILPAGASAATVGAVGATGAGLGAATATGGGALAGGVVTKAAAVVAAATMAGGVAVTGATENGARPASDNRAGIEQPGERLGQVAPRGALVPGQGVAAGKADAPGQAVRPTSQRGSGATGTKGRSATAKAERTTARGRSAPARAKAGAERSQSPKVKQSAPTGQSRDKPIGSGKSTPHSTGKPDAAGAAKGGPNAP